MKFIVVQSKTDQELEAKHRVYIRSCRVVEQESGRVMASNLHHFDAHALKKRLNSGEPLDWFDRQWDGSGHPNAAHLLAKLSIWPRS